MLNRLSVSALLQTVILATSFCVVVGFSLSAWDSWGRLQVASRIAVIADTSANMFKAMHNLRTDRSTTNRMLNSDAPMEGDIEKYLRNIRDTEMPAMGNALGLLGGIELAQQQTLVGEFDRLFKTLTPLQKEFWGEMSKPKASRRPTLTKEYMETTNVLLETLDKLSAALAADVNHKDAMIDQLLTIKQIAWLLRNTAGEASLIVSTGINTGKVAPETRLAYTKFVGGIDAAWSALELTTAGAHLPPAVSSAMAATKT
ncbi:MAG: methyl-accepting chemotaxis protein, partial [Alphaproteobacteria bacterium]